ncbi:hypothetical protein MMC13_000778 [Lambiella insularis]|nr:hypothetical protein [Lambiella insularis]
MAKLARSLQDLDIQAMWDGVQGHGVQVKICIRIEACPGTRLVLLDKTHELVQHATVTTIRRIMPPTIEANINHRLSGELSEKSPIASDAEDFLRRRGLALSQEHQLATFYKDITSLESFSPFAAAERWQEIKRESPVVKGANGTDEKASGDVKLKLIESPAFFERSETPTELGHRLSSTLNVSKRGQRTTLSKMPETRLSSHLYKDEVWRDPAGTLDLDLGNPPWTKLGQFADIRFDDGKGQDNDQESDSGYETNSKAVVSRSTRMIGSKFDRTSIPRSPCARSLKRVTITGKTHDTNSDRSTPNFPLRTPKAAGLSDGESFEAAQTSSAIRWSQDEIRRSSSDLERSLIQTSPIWSEEGGKLCLIWNNTVAGSTYEIDIEATISLTTSDRHNRQSFWIPGLPRGDVPENRSQSGGFAFYVQSTAPNSDAEKIQLAPQTLIDCHVKDSSYITGRFRLDETPMLSIRTKVPIHYINECSATISTSVILSSAPEGVTMISFDARILCEIPEPNAFADRMELLLTVRNRPSGQCHVKDGSCTILHDTFTKSTEAGDSEAIISISRNSENLHEPIELSFLVAQPSCFPFTICVPTFRPLIGKVLSESIILSQPRLPLLLKRLPGNSITAWKVLNGLRERNPAIRLERLATPSSSPERVSDNPCFQVSELSRASFKDLEPADAVCFTEESPTVARNLRVELFEIMGGGLRSQIEVDVEVEKSAKILTIDQQGWVNSFSLIDGVLATEEAGEWRETEDTYLTLFKSDDSVEGSIIHITICFQQQHSVQDTEDSEYEMVTSSLSRNSNEQPLPKIMGKTIVGAVLASNLDTCTVTLSSGMPDARKVVRTLSRHEKSEIRLPRLSPQYHLSFIDQTTPRISLMRLAPLLKLPRPDNMRPAIINPNIVVTSCRRNKKGCIRFGDEVFQQPHIVSRKPPRKEVNVHLGEQKLGMSMSVNAEPEKRHPTDHRNSPRATAKPSDRKIWRLHDFLLVILVFLSHILLIYYFESIYRAGDFIFNGTPVKFQGIRPFRQFLDYVPPEELNTRDDHSLARPSVGSIEGGEANMEVRGTASTAERSHDPAEGRHSNVSVLDWIDRALGWRG